MTSPKFTTHKVIANNLIPGTVYKYRVGSGSSDSWSSIVSFQTDAAGNTPFHFIVGSDSQASSKLILSYGRIHSEKPSRPLVILNS